MSLAKNKRLGSCLSIPLMCMLMVCTSCTNNHGRQAASGKVTFDGQPIDKGSIMFLPIGGESIKTGGPIIDGKFDIPAEKGPVSGKHRVLCFWEKDTGKTYVDRDSGDVYPVRKEGLPSVYQSENSPLEVEFSPRQKTYDFELKSQAGK
ncbi:MAG: hypothetical protein ABL921_14430 [Pirellula sp.]